MGYYDYETAYNSGKLSDFLYSKAKIFDRDGVSGLSKFEYEQFQKWFTPEDKEKYGLDYVEISKDERKEHRHRQYVSENIDNSENITNNEKKTLKVFGKVAGAGAIIGVAGGVVATGLEAAGIGGMLALGTGGLGLVVAGVGLVAYNLYKNHLEKNAEEQQQKSEGQ